MNVAGKPGGTTRHVRYPPSADLAFWVDWTALALDLGYFDQAHFIRDFKKLVGKTPTEYVSG